MSTPLQCLYTVVRSTCETDRSISFLGERGMRLAPLEQVLIPGDIRDSVARKGTDAFKALENALRDNVIEIMRTPPPIFFDAHTGYDEVRMLSVDNNAVVIGDPCWGNYTSVG